MDRLTTWRWDWERMSQASDTNRRNLAAAASRLRSGRDRSRDGARKTERLDRRLRYCGCAEDSEEAPLPELEVVLAAPMTRKRDIKQFRQACKEAGLTVRERYDASEALHAEKEAGGGQEDMSYGELLAWLRQWKESWRPS
jgi:hypothetical protein